MRKGTVNFVDSNTSKLQTVQLEGIDGEVASGVERYQSYGLSTFPMPVEEDGKGAECIIADLGSSSMRTVIQVDDRRYRPIVGNKGDVVLYSTHDNPSATHTNATQRIAFTDDGTANYRFILKINGAKIEVKSDNTIVISNASGNIQMAANGNITMNCPTLTINGNIVTTGTLTNNGKNISSTHTHSGVTAGPSNTGVPN